VTKGLKCSTVFLPILLIVSFAIFPVLITPCRSETADAGCGAVRDRWEKSLQELKDKIQEVSTIQETPSTKLAEKPLVDLGKSASIAKQVGDILQTKEDILSRKRRECREIMTLEDQVFNELQECLKNGKNTKDKDTKNLTRRRQALIDKAVIAVAEVREVEGKQTVLPYAENVQDDYRRSVNNYWQTYQQMYRRWGGY